MNNEFEHALNAVQDCISDTPVIILGSGASAAHGIPGMVPLATRLKSCPPAEMTSQEHSAWSAFESLLDTHDLESALTSAVLTPKLTKHIVDTTRTFLLPHDIHVLEKILNNRRYLPLTRLYKHLLTSTHRSIDVVTPNYDRIAEYAADAGEIAHFSGFSYGYLNTRCKDATSRLHQGGKPVRTVCIWKVHGSLDWFGDDTNQVIALPGQHATPPGYSPLMVTPGTEKYRLTYQEPFRTIFSCADTALERARSYLCIGYGFNDEHLQTKIIERCQSTSTPIVVLTRTLTDSARKFLFDGRCQNVIAIEHNENGSSLYTTKNRTGIDLPGKHIWRLSDFLDAAIGETT